MKLIHTSEHWVPPLSEATTFLVLWSCFLRVYSQAYDETLKWLLLCSTSDSVMLSLYSTLGSNAVPSAPLYPNYTSELQTSGLDVGNIGENRFILLPSTDLGFQHRCGTHWGLFISVQNTSIRPFWRDLQQCLGESWTLPCYSHACQQTTWPKHTSDLN